MDIPWEKVLAFIGQVIAAGGSAAAILYGVFAKWGEKWLDSRFAKRLQELQHVHERELENVRFSVQNTFSRVSKIHEREFEVFPKIWLMIQETLGKSRYAVESTIIYSPDFKKLSNEAIEEFFRSDGFSESQKTQVLNATDPEERSRLYYKVLIHRHMQDAQEKQRVLNNYIIENRIFMTADLDRLLTEVSRTMAGGLIAFEMGKRCGDFKLEREGADKIMGLESKLPLVLNAIQERLCHSAAATKPPFAGTAS